MMESIGNMLARAWGFFQLTEPHLGISYGSIYLGVFVIGMSLRYLVPLLGIGHSYNETMIASGKAGIRWRDERKRNREMKQRQIRDPLKNLKV